jgi:hypothetical protein
MSQRDCPRKSNGNLFEIYQNAIGVITLNSSAVHRMFLSVYRTASLMGKSLTELSRDNTKEEMPRKP